VTNEIYRYSFPSTIPLDDVEETLLLAIIATESLHGESQVRLDSAHLFDREQRACVIDAHTQVGRDLSRLFTGFVTREFGANAFSVERVRQDAAASRSHEPREEAQRGGTR
jgi:hypothetical protein